MDIFGKDFTGYEHVMALDSQQERLNMFRNRAKAIDGKMHNFNALGSHIHVRATDFEKSAAAFTYLTNNVQSVQSMIEEVLYTEFRLDEFIPFIENVPPGVSSYSYRVIDRIGRGDFIDHQGTNAPPATVDQRLISYPIEYAGIVPMWSIEDLRQAQYAGIALSTETIEAGTQGAMDHIEEVGLLGNSDRGFYGLVNQPATIGGQAHITPTAANATFAARTPDLLAEDLQEYIRQVVIDTEEVFGRTIRSGMCIYLPITQASILTETLRVDTDLSVWEWVVNNNAWRSYTGERIMLKWVKELKGAAPGNADRMIIGFKNQRIMEMAVPIMPRILNIENRSYTMSAPMEYKLSGLNVKRPDGLRYIDGI